MKGSLLDLSKLIRNLGDFRKMGSTIGYIDKDSEAIKCKVRDLCDKFVCFENTLLSVQEDTTSLNSKLTVLGSTVDRIEDDLSNVEAATQKCESQLNNILDSSQFYDRGLNCKTGLVPDGIFPRRLESCSLPSDREVANGTPLGCPPGNFGWPNAHNSYFWVPGNNSSSSVEKKGNVWD